MTLSNLVKEWKTEPLVWGVASGWVIFVYHVPCSAWYSIKLAVLGIALVFTLPHGAMQSMLSLSPFNGGRAAFTTAAPAQLLQFWFHCYPYSINYG